MFDATAAAVPQRIAHLVVAIDPAALDTDGGMQDRLDELAQRVATSGGRLPGGTRPSPAEIPVDHPLPIGEETAAQLAEWRGRLRSGSDQPA